MSETRAPAVLFLLHASTFADPREENVGGTQFHVADLVRALALPRSVIAFPDGDRLRVFEVFTGRLEEAVEHSLPRRGARDRYLLRDREGEAQVAELIDRFDVGVVHLHHLLFWPVGLWRTLRDRGVPFLFTVHDFYSVCPSMHVFDLARWQACRCTGESAADRGRCVRAMYALCEIDPPADVEARLRAHRDEFGGLLEAASVVVAPSLFASARVTEAYAERTIATTIVPHFDPPRVPPARAAAPGEPLRVGVLGAIAAPWKGAAAVVEVVRQVVASGAAVEWHLFGLTDAFTFPWDLEHASRGAEASVRMHGRYRREDIAQLLVRQQIGLTLHLSAVEETYCYTLSESWAAGVPAIVVPRGALAERVADTGAGLVVADAAGAASAVVSLAADRDALALLRARAIAAPLAAADAIAARYAEIYRPLLDRAATRR